MKKTDTRKGAGSQATVQIEPGGVLPLPDSLGWRVGQRVYFSHEAATAPGKGGGIVISTTLIRVFLGRVASARIHRRHPPLAVRKRMARQVRDTQLKRRVWKASLDELGAVALAQVRRGTSWLSAAQLAGKPLARWRARHQVFALELDGVEVFAGYQFDEALNPRPVVAKLLRVLLRVPGDMAPMRIALWFESRSSALNGQRPRELLDGEPEPLLRAAREHLAGPLHG